MPLVITQICLLYYDEIFIIKFKGKSLKQFQSTIHDRKTRKNPLYRYKIKFNQHLSFKILAAIKGWEEGHKKQTSFALGLDKDIPKCIEYFVMSWAWNCIETQSSVKTLIKSDSFSSLKYKKEDKQYILSLIGTQPQKEQNSLTFTFKIHSLLIKYKASPKFLYYPSFASVTLREKTEFTWNVDKSLIGRFKEYLSGEYYDSPIFDNLCIICHPNGFANRLHGQFVSALRFMSIPTDVSRMKLMINVKTNFKDEMEYECAIPTSLAIKRFIGVEFDLELLKDKLTFHVEMVITELYDSYDAIIPRDKWIDHNVDIS